jgi:hypothetical protein
MDIYIPSIKLAIELNGPTHYFPIFGDDKLKKTQTRDELKQKEMNEFGINLFLINISHLTSKKKTEKFLSDEFKTRIIPIIDSLIDGSRNPSQTGYH